MSSPKLTRKYFTPSTLAHMRGLIDSNTELTDRQKELFQLLIQKQTPTIKSEFENFHEWIRRGDHILTSIAAEMERLRQATDPNADLISRTSVLQILAEYRVEEPQNNVDNSINWLLDKLQSRIEKLYAREVE